MITNEEIKILEAQGKNDSLYTDEYLEDPTNENYQYIRDKILKTNRKEMITLLNEGSGIFRSIVNTFSSYVGTPYCNVPVKNIKELVRSFVILGFGYISISIMNGEYSIVGMNGKDFIGNKCFRFYKKGNTEYVLVSEYLDGGKTNSLFRIESSLGFGNFKSVPLSELPETEGLTEVEIVPNGIMTLKRIDFSESDISIIESIKKQVFSIERNIAEISAQHSKYTDPFVLLSNIKLAMQPQITNLLGKRTIERKDLPNVFFSDGGDAKIEFIENKNELLEGMKLYIETQKRNICTTCGLSPSALGINDQGVISGVSRIVLESKGLKTVLQMRGIIQDAIVFMLSQITETNITWEDLILKTDNEKLDEIERARNLGLMSQREAIQYYYGITKEQAEEKLLEITNIPNVTTGNN